MLKIITNMPKIAILKYFSFVLSILVFSIIMNGFMFNNSSGSKADINISDDDKPSEEVYKNIQVLKGTPSSELMSIMHFMRSSLNVKCGFCHVHDEKTNAWDFVSDSIEEKRTTREMIEMVKSINSNHFSNRTAVTCFTCHRGNEHPLRTPPLPQHYPDPVTESPEEKLPDAKAVIDNYFKALGVNGPDGMKNKYSKGNSFLFDGKSFPIEIYQEAPDKFLSILTAPDGSKTYRGYDGKQGWTQNSEGVQTVEGVSLTTLKDFADIYSGTELSKYTDVRVIGTDTANGSNCYVILGVINERKNCRLYFDVSSGLLIRKTEYLRTVIGSIPVGTDFGKYGTAGNTNIKAAFWMQFMFLDPRAEISREFTEVKYNISMDEVNFSPPVK